ncbi:MAG: Gmad2 immunoglobulin-like domain-containing protein [Actinomycetota bacterium]|nr:Gmad2 immunoglobulin-like domain-containing protein [Actinomycetota bacterium]
MRTSLLLFLLAACAVGEPETATTVAQPTSAPEETSTTGTSAGAPCLEQEADFVEDGVIGLLGDEGGDAGRVAALRWAGHEGCERLVVELATADGAPATAGGLVEAEILRDLGVVRLRLADLVAATAVADSAFDGTLATRAFVVRSLDGQLFVDLHLGSAALARAIALRSPARVVVDLRPGGSELPPAPPSSDLVVVLAPRGGRASFPMDVYGYARTFEANVIARVRQDGKLEHEEFTTAADWVNTWGQFTLTLQEGPEGPAELFVGEDSARDGSEQGVVIKLGA